MHTISFNIYYYRIRNYGAILSHLPNKVPFQTSSCNCTKLTRNRVVITYDSKTLSLKFVEIGQIVQTLKSVNKPYAHIHILTHIILLLTILWNS